MTAVGITFLNRIPIYFAVGLLGLGLIAILYSTLRMVCRYRLWLKLEKNSDLEVVLQKALDMHLVLEELQKEVVAQNRKKNIASETRESLVAKYLETMIPLKELPKYINKDGTPKNSLYKRIKKFYAAKDGDYFSIIPMLDDFARLLHKAKLGLNNAKYSSEKYDNIRKEFLAAQIKLNIPESLTNDINALPELSFGLNSLVVGIKVINENRSWFKNIPDKYVQLRDESDTIATTAFMKTLTSLKNKVNLAILNRGSI